MADENDDQLDPGVAVTPPDPMAVPRGTSGLPLAPTPITPPDSIAMPAMTAWANRPQAPMTDTDRMWAQMQQDFGNLPIDQAEKAVETALKFQGMRTYQQELEKGTPAQDALAKAMPMLLGTGGRGAMPRPPQTTYRDVGGVLYQMTPGQSPQAITQRQPKTRVLANGEILDETGKQIRPPSKGPEEAYDMAEFRGIQAAIRNTEHAVASGTMDPDAGKKRIADLQKQATDIRGRHSSPPATLGNGVTPPPTAKTGKRVRVIGPKGQKGTIVEGDTLPDGWKLAQ